MARPLRRLVADGWYHVFGRGTGRREIFGGPRDRKHFLELLAVLPERYRVRVHAYGLVDNHCHAVPGSGDRFIVASLTTAATPTHLL